MVKLRYVPLLATLHWSLGCSDDSGANDSASGKGATGTTTTGSGSTLTASTSVATSSATATTSSSSEAVSGGSSSSASTMVSSGSVGSGGASGSIGGTSSESNSMGSTGQGGSGGGSSGSGGGIGSATPRTECPAAPPAMQKAPATDRSLAISKDDYAQLLTQETPFQGTRGELPWHLYSPAQAAENAGERFPLLVVLHGGYGREVTDGNIMVDVAQYLLGSQNGLLTEANRAAFPTYIVLPHCRVEEGCSFGSNEWASAGGAHYQVQPQPSVAGGTALELVEHVIDTYSVDPTRVYLTGNSMGGGGAWEFASRRPELFAAVLPVSGHPPALQFLTPIADAKLPVWAFGAQNDNSNPYADTVEAVDTIDAAAGCAWLTTYTGAGHDDALWSSPYLEPGLWSWLFALENSSAPR